MCVHLLPSTTILYPSQQQASAVCACLRTAYQGGRAKTCLLLHPTSFPARRARRRQRPQKRRKLLQLPAVVDHPAVKTTKTRVEASALALAVPTRGALEAPGWCVRACEMGRVVLCVWLVAALAYHGASATAARAAVTSACCAACTSLSKACHIPQPHITPRQITSCVVSRSMRTRCLPKGTCERWRQ
jgi:hypothetical protein|eukprot:COSAG06_NODE_2941_length_6022_cov_3.468278_1_plen_188_part_00